MSSVDYCLVTQWWELPAVIRTADVDAFIKSQKIREQNICLKTLQITAEHILVYLDVLLFNGNLCLGALAGQGRVCSLNVKYSDEHTSNSQSVLTESLQTWHNKWTPIFFSCGCICANHQWVLTAGISPALFVSTQMSARIKPQRL